MTAPRPSLERARAGYDEAFREHLAAEIMSTIARESLVADANILALRTTETADALADILCTVLTLVPDMSVPSRPREAAEQLTKKIRRDVGKARAQGLGDILGASQFGGSA
jgi:hypothetical protein